MDGDVGFAGVLSPAASSCRQLAQDGSPSCGSARRASAKRWKLARSSRAGTARPRIRSRSAGWRRCARARGGHDQGFADALGEQGVAPGQKLDLARGVPPGQDEGVLGARACRWRRTARSVRTSLLSTVRSSSLVWFSQSSSTGALGPASCGVGEGQGLVDAFGIDFVLGQLEVGVDARRQAQLR